MGKYAARAKAWAVASIELQPPMLARESSTGCTFFIAIPTVNGVLSDAPMMPSIVCPKGRVVCCTLVSQILEINGEKRT